MAADGGHVGRALSVPVASLVLPQGVKAKLLGRGYLASDDLLNVTPDQLARDCALLPADVPRVLAVSAAAGRRPPSLLACSQTAEELLELERVQRPIITFCKELDELLRGGVRRGQLTELCGEPGAGKTQLVMQLALTAQIPTELGGVGGQALYIDTEGSFSTERLEQMAQALSAHLLAAEGSGSSPARLAAARATTAAVLLEGVHVARAHSHREQLALGVALPELLRARGGRVRLVVLDSVAFHFRHGFGADYGARTRALLAHGLALLRASVEHDCAVVVVNQVTTKIGGSGSGGAREEREGPSILAPALGETWAHVANTRIQLTRRGRAAADGSGPERSAIVEKSATAARAAVAFRVTAEGVRSVRRPKRALACVADAALAADDAQPPSD